MRKLRRALISQNSGYPLFCKAERSKRIRGVCGARGGGYPYRRRDACKKCDFCLQHLFIQKLFQYNYKVNGGISQLKLIEALCIKLLTNQQFYNIIFQNTEVTLWKKFLKILLSPS